MIKNFSIKLKITTSCFIIIFFFIFILTFQIHTFFFINNFNFYFFIIFIPTSFVIYFFIFCISEENNKLGNSIGLAFGGILTALIFTGSNISGSSFNPARSLAPAVLQAISGGDTDPLKQIWIYIIGPLVGGVLSFYAWKIFDK